MNKAGTQTIETERLILRRFTINDAEDMYNNWASNPNVNKFLTWPLHPNADFTRSLIEGWVSGYKDGGCFNWAIEYRENSNVIGNISVVELNEKLEAAEIGYCMCEDYWGRELMPEALKAVMDYLFDVVGLNRVGARHDIHNEKSGRVMDKVGMKREGILRDAAKNNQGIHDIEWHSTIRRERNISGELNLRLEDVEWPFTFTDHDRNIARGIVFDDAGNFYFVRAERDDDFGRATLIETAGGGVEPGEELSEAIKRELNEELGAEVEVICKIGVVSDYYNLIHRHNINNYFLCRAVSFGEKHLMPDEIEDFHLSTLKLSYDEAMAEYELRRETPIGRLIANREMPILKRAHEILMGLGQKNV